ncbi:hypothetical protein ACIFQM_24240 [Paenibacillus sp. NRS-1782]|uniref:hypothetical protein n=1 Tax=unclassified Paenibacillus TaxID=185978 RepID=UPI003D2C1571
MKYIQEFLELNVKDKTNIEKLLFLSIPLLSEIILEKKYFSHNKDLKHFTNEILTQDYKDYLFDSRPALYARLIKDLRNSKLEDLDYFIKLEKTIQGFMIAHPELNVGITSDDDDLKSVTKKTKSKNKTNPKVISDWRSVIESKE